MHYGYVCLLFDFYPLNLERIAVSCSSGFTLPVWFFIIARVTNTRITVLYILFKILAPAPIALY